MGAVRDEFGGQLFGAVSGKLGEPLPEPPVVLRPRHAIADQKHAIPRLQAEWKPVREALHASGQAGGWYLVCVDGFPLGWGKVSRGILKNKYLPGWRICG